MKIKKNELETFAKIANSSYISPQARPLYNKQYGLNSNSSSLGLIYDGDLSDKYSSVYLDPKSKKIHMSIRGTQLNKGFKEAFEDLTDDFFVATNNVSITRRYKESEKRLKELQAKYPDYEINLYGHSLGGAVSYELGKAYNLTSHSFSTGSGYRGTFDFGRSFDKAETSKHNFYHTDKFVILSNTSKILQGNHYIVIVPMKSETSSHSMMNFIYSSTK
jgi:hypothetical protein